MAQLYYHYSTMNAGKSLEILKILHADTLYHKESAEIKNYLEKKKNEKPHLEKLITNGLKLVNMKSNETK